MTLTTKSSRVLPTVLLFVTISAQLFGQKFYSENAIKEHWKSNGIDQIEGIYESTGSYKDNEVACTDGYGRIICYGVWRSYSTKYKLALVKSGGDYTLIYLSGTTKGPQQVGGCECGGTTSLPPEENIWKVGEVKAKLYKTATPNVFKCEWYMLDKKRNPDAYITFDNLAYFTLILEASDQDKDIYLKLYPTAEDGNVGAKASKSSGTGFAISSDGIIVTNYHVVDGAQRIKVRGVSADFDKSYDAQIRVVDKNNDLALIQIVDSQITSLGSIPFVIRNNLSAVGENVFVLGYPLRATMGDEIKLTNGIVSSKTGFQGDITSYQISAPVQPGNSGGPLFDEQGNVIGIINAKHVGAENASYAVKTTYLTGLVQLLPSPPKLQTTNSLTGKSLPQQVDLIKKYVYIIETE